MKFIIEKIVPLLVSGILVFLLFYNTDILQKKKTLKNTEIGTSFHFSNYKQPEALPTIISALKLKNTILLIGSSELSTIPTDLNARADLFFQNYKTNLSLVSLGHAGNQSMSIYSQLLALHNYIYMSKISIIISPGWFTNGYQEGTSLASFLEFNNEAFLSEILKNQNDTFKLYISNYIYNHYNDINTPSNIHKLFIDYNNRISNPIKSVFEYPLYLFHDFIHDKISDSLIYKYNTLDTDKIKYSKTNKSIIINWNCIEDIAIKQHNNNSTNNTWSINNDYFKNYINGELFHQTVQSPSKINELTDLKMLLYLLNYYNVDASFIIQPLNPYAYDNLQDLKPVITYIKNEIEKYNYPYYDMFVYDTLKYEKGTLTDIMHFGEYGWFKVDKFLIDTYEK